MSRIRSSNTGPERTVRGVLAGMGARFHVQPDADGRPDFMVRKWKAPRWKAFYLFVHGCFWHRCPRHYRAPKTNRGFWSAKVERNAARHLSVVRSFAALGIPTMTMWECETWKAKSLLRRKLKSLR